MGPWAAALGGLAWLLWLGGARAIPPTRLDWAMREDWAGTTFGWLFYRNAPWGLPLTRSPNQLFPHGTSVALTDANPLLAVLFKLFNPLLPADFQYHGLWLALGFALMGWFGAKLVSVVSPRPTHQWLGGLLFAMAPPLAARLGHLLLCAHWMLVAMMWLHLRDTPDARAAKRSLLWAAALNAVAASTHPYLVAMLAPLAMALTVRLALGRVITWGRALLASAGFVVLDLLLFALFGYFAGGSLGAEGFGQFSADLTTLFNPTDWSRLLPSLPVARRQGEGFGYVGAGALLLGVLAVAGAALRFRSLRDVPWKRGLPFAVAVLLLAVYALSSRVTWTGRLVVDLGGLYEPFSRLTSAFRASGRFIWPLCYAVMGGALLLWLRQWRERAWVGTAVLALVVAVQAYDLRQDKSELRRRPDGFRRLQAPEWAALKGHYRHLALFPPQVQWVCPYNEPLVNAAGYLAYRLGLTFNSGYASRTPPSIAEECNATMRPGGVDADTVYVVVRPQVGAFVRAGARCGVLEGLAVCVAGQREDAFAQALTRQPLR
ncbi:DUF6311 domain-containing protein [Corallococcus macrosporus]|uniref:Glycosyltransferase RgtA/B/C/D-like domain-containing protein n=1 Tax=Corallococcus macrosporus DSM 14697 TaxID=1189310 RepID=A0A250K491_9BACT|nr:DUF6311 domain-containing protein [Corallococcus macrosporus]ATB50720.1 hypothetical protein MYMAC_006376 [Corallococcus macrosporus DSM 14697]